MEQAKSLTELYERVSYCPYCRTFDPPIRVVESYWSAKVGKVYLLSCAKCHRPILCGRIEEQNEKEQAKKRVL